MENRLFTSDQSLNVKLGEEYDTEWQDLIEDKQETHDRIIENKDELNYRRSLFSKAFEVLNEREKEIIKLRKLSENPLKLEDLSKNTFNKFMILKNFERQALHAYHLGFDHPTSKKRMDFDIEIPEDFKNLIELLLKY